MKNIISSAFIIGSLFITACQNDIDETRKNTKHDFMEIKTHDKEAQEAIFYTQLPQEEVAISAVKTKPSKPRSSAELSQATPERTKQLTQTAMHGQAYADASAAAVSLQSSNTPKAKAKPKYKKERHQASQQSGLAEHAAVFAQFHQTVHPQLQVAEHESENYRQTQDNSIKQALSEPVSTFSIDVDTASFSNVRRLLNQGVAPQAGVVRVEEFINYFTYVYASPKKQPFSVYTEVGPSPWHAGKHLLHIGIQGKKVAASERPASNLVFLVDVSGSMQNANKLGLLKSAFNMMTQQFTENDRVSIVVYAGAAGVVLAPTAGNKQAVIAASLNNLRAGGSTNGGAGIHAAYAMAEQAFIKDGINRVILATDGDFNVGTSSESALKQLIEAKRESGVSLSVLGFGRGNYNDALMQTLAQNGNGNAYYIDTLNEARKVLVEELSATLMTIAKDVKIQIEFNPALVSEYRLVGYETRALKREDFNNDKVDAGEIGAGHSVTALYELSLVGSEQQAVDPLRYQAAEPKKALDDNGELAFLRLRYKAPNGHKSQLIETPIKMANMREHLSDTSDSYRFAAAVAGFAQRLRGGAYSSTLSYAEIANLAKDASGDDENGYRHEFVQLVKLAQQIMPKQLAYNQ